MKTINEILENYSDYKTFLDDRFGIRLCEFLTPEQAEKIGFKFKDEYRDSHVPKEWTEENVLEQLKEDVKFGIEKAVNHRGISSELMQNVVITWCKVLENGLENSDYGWYGSATFQAVNDYYNFNLINKDTFDDDFYKEW